MMSHTCSPPAAAPPPRRGLSVALALGLLGLLLGLTACNNQPPLVLDDEVVGPPVFEDVTDKTGIRFTYHNGEEAEHFAILESLGGGLAVLDYDGDGLLDLYFPGGGYYTGRDKKQIKGHPGKLYRNLGSWHFKDVTHEAGLEGPLFYTHGAAVSDYDRDGWPDLLVTGWQRLALYHNEPVDPKNPKKARKFVEVSKQAGLPEGLWTTSAAWGDVDGDGYPDLYVCQYVDWSFRNHPEDCTYDGKTRDVCPPKKFTGLPHKLFLNEKGPRGRTFRDVSKEAGLRMHRSAEELARLTGLSAHARKRLQDGETSETKFGKGLGAMMVDVNGDGKPDIYVANDTVDNFLYFNRTRAPGKPLFEEKGMETGTARDSNGNPNGSMGLGAADVNGTGRPAIFVSNYEGEMHALYINHCAGRTESFTFGTQTAGLVANGQESVGWGTGFLDFDHDGWDDLVYTTGHAIRVPKKLSRRQEPFLFHNEGKGRYKDVTRQGGPYFQVQHLGRGLVLADLDNDGRLDLVISHINEPVAVLRNVADTGGNHWLGVELKGKDHRDVVGARLVLDVDGRKLTRFAIGGGSYASSADRRHIFGLGKSETAGTLTVTWPSGKQQTWKGLGVDSYHRLQEE